MQLEETTTTPNARRLIETTKDPFTTLFEIISVHLARGNPHYTALTITEIDGAAVHVCAVKNNIGAMTRRIISTPDDSPDGTPGGFAGLQGAS